jgi:hypothetical protein
MRYWKKCCASKPEAAGFTTWISAKTVNPVLFSVVVFSSDLKNVGDMGQLVGKTIEIRGEVKEYDGRAQIILQKAVQLDGGGVRLSPLPKSFDVEERGHFSAGQSHAAKRPTTSKKKQSATLPIDVPEDAESD